MSRRTRIALVLALLWAALWTPWGVKAATQVLTVLQGGTGASTASGARTNLGAAASGVNSDIVALGGSSNLFGATRSVSVVLASALQIVPGLSLFQPASSTGLDLMQWGHLVVSGGITSASLSGKIDSNGNMILNQALSVPSITGMTTPLPLSEGGIGATSLSAAGIAASGANADITSLSDTTQINPPSVSGAPSGYPSYTGGLLNFGAGYFTDNSTAASGTAGGWAGTAIQAPTLSASNSSVTTGFAASLLVKAPVAGTNETITLPFAVATLGNLYVGGTGSTAPLYIDMSGSVSTYALGIYNSGTLKFGITGNGGAAFGNAISVANNSGAANTLAIDNVTVGNLIKATNNSATRFTVDGNGSILSTDQSAGLTSSDPNFNGGQIWNNSSSTFYGVLEQITPTAFGFSSRIYEAQNNGTEVWGVDPNGGMVSSSGTLTASDPGLSVTQAWNSGGTTFNGIIEAVTNTASAAASRLITLTVGGTEKFGVDASGTVYSHGGQTHAVNAYTSSQTLTTANWCATFTAAGATTATLPSATGSGQEFIITSGGAGTCTVTCAGADKINGSGTYALSAQYKYLHIVDSASGVWVNIGSN